MTEGGASYTSYILNSRNGYAGTGVLLAGSGGSDKPNLSSDYFPGPLGGYYYPTNGGPGSLFNLINAGSRSPATAGLYQYTVKAAANSKDGTESPATVDIGFHYVAVNAGSQPLDTDGDGMADFVEDRNGNGTYEGGTDYYNWQSADTDGNGLGDLQQLEVSYNVLVNDPAQDYGNEQNTQFESTVAVLDGNVIAAYVDANQGVYGFGGFWQQYPGLPTPRFVGYAVSRDHGVGFEDKGNPPLSTLGAGTSDDGDAGDPVLAVDRNSRTVYLAGTSSRNAGHKGIPLWTSTDGGVTFGNPINVRTDVNTTDKPWIAVDNATGTGLHDLYLTFTQNSGSPKRAWLTVSADGALNNWTTDPSYTYLRSIGDAAGPGLTVFDLACPVVVIGSDHVAYVFWLERTSDSRNWLRVRQALNRGTALGSVNTIRELVSTTSPYGNLALKRTDNPVVTGDTFRAFPFPVPAVNPSPSKANHLYVAYADKVQGTADNADIFLVRSTDGGANWTAPVRVNNDATLRDQWMPVLAVKPDGTKLLVAWYDRRNDPNNSMIEVYGRWENIATDGTVTLGTEFKISTASFPPVFAGTLPGNTATGQYDPVYPPGGLDLTWHYGSAWPSGETTVLSWRDHVGEYDGAWADGQYVYVTWTDNRLLFSSPAPGAVVPRNNRDIRFVRITWP